jgi:hypothetical protein
MALAEIVLIPRLDALPARQAAHRHQETTTLELVFCTGSVRPGCLKTFARGPGSECLVGPARLGRRPRLGSVAVTGDPGVMALLVVRTMSCSCAKRASRF